MAEATQDTGLEPYPHLKRNFALGVINGGLFVFAEALMSIDTVLTWFVQQLGGSNFLIGLVGPMRDAGWFLPQLFVSHRLQREPLKMPLYRRAAAVRSVRVVRVDDRHVCAGCQLSRAAAGLLCRLCDQCTGVGFCRTALYGHRRQDDSARSARLLFWRAAVCGQRVGTGRQCDRRRWCCPPRIHSRFRSMSARSLSYRGSRR